MKKYIVTSIIFVVGLLSISEIMVATARSNSTNSDRLEINNTNPSDSQIISVSREEFWKIFQPLLEPEHGVTCSNLGECGR